MIGKEVFRQLIVITGLTFTSLTDGFIFGQMSGMLDALHLGDDSISLTPEDLSWIAAIINFTCFIGFAMVGVVTEVLGRRKAFSIITSPLIFCWLMVYFGRDKITLLISRALVGISFGGSLMLVHISVGEYASPKNRALCLNMISSIGSLTGTLLGHVLCLLIHWRNVALIGLFPTIVSAILPFFWVESPLWLASKGRFEESKKAFTSLHKPNEENKTELVLLINAQKNKEQIFLKNTQSNTSYLQKIITACKEKYFWRIMVLGLVANIYRVASGRVMFGTYAITMLQEIAGRSEILFFTFFVDGFAILGAFISCFLISKFKLRSLLFTIGTASNFILLAAAFCIYYWPINNSIISWSKVTLLALYFITTSAGPYTVVETLMAEIFPLHIKTFCLFVQAFTTGVVQFLSIKLAPKMFIDVGYHGVFLLHVCIITLCLVYLWIFLPETKSKTLQEIELFFRNGKLQDGDSVELDMIQKH